MRPLRSAFVAALAILACLPASAAEALSTTPVWKVEGDQISGFYGAAVASVGDVNEDGYDDIMVGAYAYDAPSSNEGRAFLYLGSPTGPQTTPAWTMQADEPDSYFGWTVGPAGDVNGDGHPDVIIGAKQYGHGSTFDGRVYVFLGTGSGLSTTPDWTIDADQAGAELGSAAAGAGDVNGDGFDDVIVGAYHYTNGQFFEGRAYIYLGSASGLATTPVWQVESNQIAASLGVIASSAGDVNGDGFDDVMLGVYPYDNGQSDEGEVFLYLGSPTGPSTTPSWSAESNQAGADFGYSVASAGDVNHDGFGDVVIGAVSYDNGQMNEGRAFAYYGSPTGLPASANWTVESNQVSAQLGFSVASAGDVDGDGFDDVIVGGSLYDNGQVDEGRAWVYLGSPTGLSTTAAWMAEPDVAVAQYGYAVASAGDVNGDGASDVIVGSHDYNDGQFAEGAAFVYLGASSGTPAGRVPDTGTPLRIGKSGSQLAMTWGPSCMLGDNDYEIYEGAIGGTFTSHTSIFCTTGGATAKTFTPAGGNTYYLVVPRNATREGSYGKNSAGVERPVGANACLARQIAACP